MNPKNENYNLCRTDKEFMSLMMLILISHKRTGTVYRHFPKLFIIICQIPLFIIPPTTCISLVKEKNRLSEVMKQKSSEALDFRPMNGSGLTPAPSHASKDTYYWNKPTPEELLLSYNQGRRSENFPQRFTKTTNSSTHLKEASHSKIGKPRGKTYNYRPNLWTSLKTENCYRIEPLNVLTTKEIDQYEQSLYSSSNPYSHSVRVIRGNVISTDPERLHVNPLSKKWVEKIPIPLSTWPRGTWQGQPKTGARKFTSAPPKRPLRNRIFQSVKRTKSRKGRLRWPRGRARRSHADQLKTQITSESRSQAPDNSQIVITVHRVFIRPSVISLENGDLHARIRYIIQLHRKLTGFYRLNMEVRTDPSYPPIYVGNIQNVCAHWPANLPQSNCSMNKSRFYQKGQICFCHMPPGIYRQRLRLNLTNILEGLEIPKFLVNFLFNGKEISIHLLIKLEDENDELVGCLNLTLPILLKSA